MYTDLYGSEIPFLQRYSCVKNAINKCNILAGLGLVRIVKNSNLGLENAARGLGVDFDCKQYLTEYIRFHVYGFIRIRETILTKIFMCEKCYKQMHGNNTSWLRVGPYSEKL